VTDSLGATKTSSTLNVTAGTTPSITFASGLSGKTINDDRISVSGSVQAPSNSGVTVNGQLATVASDGKYFLNNVPLVAGSNTIIATVTTMDGQTAFQFITVTSIGPAPFTFTASPTVGIGSVPATSTLTQRGNVSMSRVEFSRIAGVGTPTTKAAVAEASGMTCSYSTPGMYVAKVDIYDQSSNLAYTGTQTIYVATPQEVARIVRSVYTQLTGCLKDAYTTVALSLFMGDYQQQYSDLFTKLGADLPSAAAQLGQISRINLAGERAEIVIVRNVNGDTAVFLMRLTFGDDGIWRIEAM
jgi:hypothetical protein